MTTCSFPSWSHLKYVYLEQQIDRSVRRYLVLRPANGRLPQEAKNVKRKKHMNAAIAVSIFIMPTHVSRSFLIMTPPRIVPIAPAGSSTSPATRVAHAVMRLPYCSYFTTLKWDLGTAFNLRIVFIPDSLIGFDWPCHTNRSGIGLVEQ